ncbi:MAG: acyltransferase [Taibaiella sp.]|nr:acyltransferase [Taibaiella sp.]
MAINIYNRLRRITSNQLYFPEIDGIRFLAIILVILFHAHGYFVAKTPHHFADGPANYPLLETLLSNGDRGVELFFVLSGFILCLPFAKQYIGGEKKVQLKKYYLRRVTRLEPPYFIAMTALLLLHLAMNVHSAAEIVPSWLASLIYSHNFIFGRTPLLTVVAWSLEIEIQFYLIAPLLFKLLSLSLPVRRTALIGGIAGIVLLQWFFPAPDNFISLYSFAQYFLTGILLSDFYVSQSVTTSFRNNVWVAVGCILLAAILYLPIKTHKDYAQESFILASRIAFPFCIGLFYYIVMKNGAVKKIFSYKFVPIIGGMCYSIYLLHYTIISGFGRLSLGWRVTDSYLVNLAVQMLVLMIPVLAISALFYYLIERPFMAGKWTDMLMGKSKAKEENSK